jgi:hypothetical protein
MNRIALMLTAIVITFVCFAAYAQEDSEENTAFEKLKVLEPMIGTWHFTWSNEETGEHGEVHTTFSWAPEKRMIVSASKLRKAQMDKDFASLPWNDGGPRIFYVWNSKAESIEEYAMFTVAGTSRTCTVTPNGDGRFDLKEIRATTDSGTYDLNYELSDNTMTIRFSNHKTSDGEPQEDREIVMSRVK